MSLPLEHSLVTGDRTFPDQRRLQIRALHCTALSSCQSRRFLRKSIRTQRGTQNGYLGHSCPSLQSLIALYHKTVRRPLLLAQELKHFPIPASRAPRLYILIRRQSVCHCMLALLLALSGRDCQVCGNNGLLLSRDASRLFSMDVYQWTIWLLFCHLCIAASISVISVIDVLYS